MTAEYKKVAHRYLIYTLSHTVLLVDAISARGVTEILPAEGKAVTFPGLHFRSWQWAERFLLERGASQELMRKTRDQLRKTSLALVQIMD